MLSFNVSIFNKILQYYPRGVVGFPDGLDGKESAYIAGDAGCIPGLGRSPGEGEGYPLQCPSLENSMECVAHRVVRSQM